MYIFILKAFCLLLLHFLILTELFWYCVKIKRNQLRTTAPLNNIYIYSILYEGMYTNHSSDGLEQLEILYRQLYALQVHAQVHSTIWCLTAHQKPFAYCNNNTLCPLDIISFRMSLCFFLSLFPSSILFLFVFVSVSLSVCSTVIDIVSLSFTEAFIWVPWGRPWTPPLRDWHTHTHIDFSE